MKYAPLLLGPVLAFAAFALGCNTAQISTPPLIDAGPPCPTRIIVSCDAGTVTPGACGGGVTVALDLPDASATIPAGSFALGCQVTFSHADQFSSDCLPYSPCTCFPPATDAGDDGGDAEAVDAGPSTVPGVWSCALPTQ